jgi:hypothetical protein
MAKHLFLVFTEAQPGKDAEFNTWYDNRHIPDVLSVPGFTAAQRFRLQPQADQPDAPPGYLAIYEIETDDVQATMASLMSRAGTPAMPFSDALNLDATKMFVADPLAARVVAKPVEA